MECYDNLTAGIKNKDNFLNWRSNKPIRFYKKLSLMRYTIYTNLL